MKRLILILFCCVLFFHQRPCLAADLIEQVPLTSPAYAQLHLLFNRGMLPDARADLFTSVPPRTLTRYDFVFMLLEPMERFVVLANSQDGKTLSPEQRRRSELVVTAMASLSPADTAQLLKTASNLLETFRSDIAQISPDLPGRASLALLQLRGAHLGLWDRVGLTSAFLAHGLHVSIDPKANPNQIGSPLPFQPFKTGPGESLFMVASGGTPLRPSPVAIHPLTSLEAAVDLDLGRVNLYGSFTSLPGQDPMSMLKLDMNGKAMLGFRFDLGKVRDLGLSGILEYHVMRTGDPANPDISTGAVGGIGVQW